jgi:NADH-quinone oxidoreductase subunit J
MNQIIFYILSGICIISAILVVTLRNVMHSALSLALTLVSVAGLFILMNTDFLAGVQMLLYAGGVMVLILFAILLTQKITGKLQPQTNEQKLSSLLVCLILGIILFVSISGLSLKISKVHFEKGTTPGIGNLILTTYLLPFEIASVILLVVIVGITILAKKDI